jgi:hypothetical protein
MAPTDRLPQANGFLVLVLALVGTLFELLAESVQTQEGTIAFLVGAIALMISALGLYRLTAPALALPVPEHHELTRHHQFLGKLLMGVVAGFLLQTLYNLLATNLYPVFPLVSPRHLRALTLLMAALTSHLWNRLVARGTAAVG